MSDQPLTGRESLFSAVRQQVAERADPGIVGTLVVTSASWLCPICNRPGDRHLTLGGCFVGEVARESLAAHQDAKMARDIAYKQGFADAYAKQVVDAMDEPNKEWRSLWCAVEGCQEPPTLLDLATNEIVCRAHLDYGAE